MTDGTRRRVGCHLAFEVTEPATFVLQVAPAASAGALAEAELEITLDGDALPVEELAGDHGMPVHLLHSAEGDLQIRYRAAVEAAAPSTPSAVEPRTDLDVELLTYLRQSRYCPHDHLGGFAAYELGHLPVGPELVHAVGAWVASRLTYEGGTSTPTDTAVDSLLAGKGVCRDFAHLAITMLRALEVPARLVSVYAPGLSPMDFHAVVEAHVDGAWTILDPTRLAPRQSLVRVATGRDAADTAFVTVLGGVAPLVSSEVTAVTDGDLPSDDHTELVALA
jgi:transglutaminase-like putative cysteine protease